MTFADRPPMKVDRELIARTRAQTEAAGAYLVASDTEPPMPAAVVPVTGVLALCALAGSVLDAEKKGELSKAEDFYRQRFRSAHIMFPTLAAIRSHLAGPPEEA